MYNYYNKEYYIFNIRCYSLLMVGNKINLGKKPNINTLISIQQRED